MFIFFTAQQVRAEHGRQRQRHYRRGCQGGDEGDAQRDEHAPLHAAQEEQGHEADDDDERGVEDGHAHLARGVEHYLQHGQTALGRQEAVFVQAAPDVLHIDDGVIDQRTDGDGHTAQTHGVDGEPHVVEHQHGHDERQGQGDERNEGRPHVGQEEEQHDDHEDAAFDERLAHVADGAFDEAALAEDVGRYLHVGGQVLLQVLEGGFQLAGQLQRAGGGLLGHGEQHGGFAPFRGQSQLGRLRADAHVGHVFQQDGGGE